ncbi:serine/threonine protein kinase [Brazilian marseillevirus]|uniref:serine/threonine protein kinase n=1 Tax=Brazilian marseillevirus TaxID=1813599 RepID=UPI000785154D|nr:serine/threonine protein kinase [Brazilian marseillevirus]AMQ10666.1 serine/threonine protein kinase [Brazilian marseillevirus]
MSFIKKFEVGSGGTASLFKRGDEYFVYKRPHEIFEPIQLVEYQVQLALWKRYNEGFVKPLFSEMRDERLCFAMEWFESKHFEMENVADINKVAKTLCRCFRAMEEEGVYHQDIGPHNILWDKRTDDVKLIDFGMIVRYQNETEKKHFDISVPFLPIECENNKEMLFTREEASKIQVWILGDLLLQILMANKKIREVSRDKGREVFEESVQKLCEGNERFIERAILAALQREPQNRKIL